MSDAILEEVSDPPPAARNRGRRVLIVDDDRDFADALATILTLEGYETAVAYGDQQARAAIADFDARVAILDYQLGRSTGVELVDPLKARRPDIVCILATAYAQLDTAVEALRHGIHDYFRKPLHTEELLATLDRCFEMLRLREEKRAAEAALREARKTEAVAQVAGGVAHHFNNLLMVMRGNLEFLEEELADRPEAIELVEKVMRATDRAATITQGLLAYSRSQLLRPQSADLGKLAREAVAEMPAETIGKIEIQWDMPAAVWPVRIDPSRFKGALRRLIRNAVTASPPGAALVIAVTNEAHDQAGSTTNGRVPSGRYVVVSVTDRGRGMAPEIAERAFEPFYSAKGLADKMGLGLSIVYGFARQSGGQATLDSEEGRGTTVRLYFPRADLEPGSTPPSP